MEKAVEDSDQIKKAAKALSQRLAIFANKLIGETDSFQVEIKTLQQSLATAEKSAKALGNAEEATKNLKEAKDIIQGLGPGGDLRKFCKPKTPMALRIMLGDKINVVPREKRLYHALRSLTHSHMQAARSMLQALTSSESLPHTLPHATCRFRVKSAYIMLFAPALLAFGMHKTMMLVGTRASTHSFTPVVMTGVQSYLIWLSYFYMAMSMRENVLMVNGSHIKAWWVQHHYWAAGTSMLLLGLPVYSPAFIQFCYYFLCWSVFQGVVMFVQNRYQQRRMYTRIALGRNTAMDVVSGETSSSSGQMLILYPLLLALQGTQIAIGVGLMIYMYPAWLTSEGWYEAESQELDLRGMRGVFLSEAAFFNVGIPNVFNVITV
eukprot:gene22842-30016_t